MTSSMRRNGFQADASQLNGVLKNGFSLILRRTDDVF